MTSLSAAYRIKSRSINWLTASLLAVWVVLVSLAAESLGEPQQSAHQTGEKSLLMANIEHGLDEAICKVFSQAKELLDS